MRRLERNAGVVSKQAAKSSDECRDITLFDWSTFTVYDFNSAKTRKGIPKGIFFKEDEMGTYFVRCYLDFLSKLLLSMISGQKMLKAPGLLLKKLTIQALHSYYVVFVSKRLYISIQN